MDIYRFFMCAALAVLAGDVAGESCSDAGVHGCLFKYTLQLVLRMLEGVEKVCSTRDSLKNATYRCIQEESRGCDVPHRTRNLNAMQHLHASFYVVLERILCKPSPECSILQLLSCYGNLFQDLEISFPVHSHQIPVFVDGLLSRMFKDQPKICRKEGEIDVKAVDKCMKDKMAHLFKSCIAIKVNTSLTDVQSGDSPLYAGYQAEAPEKEVEGMIMNALGLLATPSALARALRIICSKECVDYASRYTMVRNCTRIFVSQSLRALNDDAIGDDDTCRSVSRMYTCVARVAQHCPALSEPSPVNEPIQELMNDCHQRFSSASPLLPSAGVILLLLVPSGLYISIR